MKRFFPILPVLLLFSCTGGESSGVASDDQWQPPEVVDTILSIDRRLVNDTVRIGGRLLSYAFEIAPDTSLAVVTNADGLRSYDNVAQLTVCCGQETLLRRTFRKEDFAAYVPQGQMSCCTLAGFALDRLRMEESDALRFIATVGDPDDATGINYPVELIISPSGTLHMERAEDLETSPLVPDLNVAPDR